MIILFYKIYAEKMKMKKKSEENIGPYVTPEHVLPYHTRQFKQCYM